jgi:hypothetical protein
MLLYFFPYCSEDIVSNLAEFLIKLGARNFKAGPEVSFLALELQTALSFELVNMLIVGLLSELVEVGLGFTLSLHLHCECQRFERVGSLCRGQLDLFCEETLELPHELLVPKLLAILFGF